MTDTLATRCARLSDEELLRALTTERQNYSRDFLEAAEGESISRGLPASGSVGRVRLETEDSVEDLSIDEVLQHLVSIDQVWAPEAITWASGATCVVQRDLVRWVVHYYPDDAYLGSGFIDSKESLRAALVDRPLDTLALHDLDRWTSVARTKSARLTGRLCKELDDAEILNTVRDADSSGTERTYAVIVPNDQTDEAGRIAAQVLDRVRALYRRAEDLSETEDREDEIAVYSLLVDLVPDNLAVYYNRGAAHLESGAINEAAADFIQALALTEPESGRLRPRRRSDPWGGMLSGGQTTIQIHPAIPDINAQLLRILEQIPHDLSVIRGLADIARLRGRLPEARARYRELLAHTPDDGEAAAFLELLAEDEEDTAP